MATAAATITSDPTEPDPTMYLWQVPVFLIGAVVFVAAWQGWLPLGTPDPGADFARDLAALRIAVEKVTPERDEMTGLLAQAADRVDSFPEQAASAHFILGSGYGRLAELSPEPDDARKYWILAKQQFDQLREKQLADPEDWPRLAFRSTKAAVAVGLPQNTPPADLRQYISRLGNAPAGEDAGEAGRLQADLAMRLSPPDTLTATESLTRYMRATGVATPSASLARAKLLLGDIHFRRKEHDLARKWLEQIGADAPPEVIAPGKMLLAQVKMKEAQDWLGAARDLEALRAQPGVSRKLLVASAYYLGVCKVNTREPEAATKLFEEAIKGEGQEAVAADVRLADLYLKGNDAAKRVGAPDLLASAVKGVTTPKEFRNQLVRVDMLQETFDLAFSVLLADKAYEPAVKAADYYAAVAVAGRDREKKAEVLAAWAESLRKEMGDFKPKAAAAAAEYEALALLQPAASAKADVLRRAAAMHRLAGEPGKAVEVLQGVIRLPELPESAAVPTWSDLVDSLIAAKRPDEVWDVINEIMKAGNPLSTAIRYRLARQFTDARRPDLSKIGSAFFEQIANQQTVAAAEQDYHERALVELAHECIRAKNYTGAEVWLRKQISIYPTGPEAPLGRLLLGVSLLQQAEAPPTPGLDLKNAAAKALLLRREALEVFQKIVADADKKLAQEKKLEPRDAWLRLQGGLRILQTYQQLQQPDLLLGEAAILLDRHRGTIEELIIQSLIFHAFKQKGKTSEALQTRDNMKALFDQLPASAFVATEGEYSRKYWAEKWFSGK